MRNSGANGTIAQNCLTFGVYCDIRTPLMTHCRTALALLNGFPQDRARGEANAMSLGVIFKGPEGIALTADSRLTLPFPVPGTDLFAQAFYDNSSKLLKIIGQDYVAAITVGLGAIGMQVPRTASSFLPEFEQELGQPPIRLSVVNFSTQLSDFFLRQWRSLMKVNLLPPGKKFDEMVFLVAGYNDGEINGRVYRMTIPSNPAPTELQVGADFGLHWEGQSEITTRIINGFDASSLAFMQKHFAIPENQFPQFINEFKARSTLPIPWQFISLQDGLNLCILLVRVTSQLQQYTAGIRGVGGPIDAATITRNRGIQMGTAQGNTWREDMNRRELFFSAVIGAATITAAMGQPSEQAVPSSAEEETRSESVPLTANEASSATWQARMAGTDLTLAFTESPQRAVENFVKK